MCHSHDFLKKKTKNEIYEKKKTLHVVDCEAWEENKPMVLLGQNEWTGSISIGGGKIKVSENVFSVCLAMAFLEACMAQQMPIPAVVQNNDRAPFR